MKVGIHRLRGMSEIVPSMRTCRRRLFQWKHMAAFGFSANCLPFSLPSFVKKQNPPSEKLFIKTMRTLGIPSKPVVASATAFGSFGSLASASFIQLWKRVIGSEEEISWSVIC